MTGLLRSVRTNLRLWITVGVLVFLFLSAVQGMEPKDWVITLLRGLSVGAITFLVASGFSLIFGLMDVLNMAHGTFFMIGAYVGWSVMVRPDTFIDVLTPVLLLASGFVLLPLWDQLIRRFPVPDIAARIWPWVGLLLAGWGAYAGLTRYPITIWDPGNYANSPVTNAFEASQNVFRLPEPEAFAAGISQPLVLGGILLAGMLAAFSVAGLSARGRMDTDLVEVSARRLPWSAIFSALAVLVVALVVFVLNTPITELIFSWNSTWVFLLAILVAIATSIVLGGLTEIVLIRPLYERTIYQLMLTLGLSAIGVEFVRAVWGLQEFTMPRPAIFNGTGEGCPAESLAALIANQCATIRILDGRVRTYNEIFIPILGLVVLIGVWLLLKRTKLGMIVRAGVQDSEMVEALGINVRRVFTLVFALGVGLAALGGVIGAPSTGLTTNLGVSLLLNVLIALAIGGLTSYPGAALGSLIVGMLQQFIIKYGQIGINLPFLAEPFKPTPPLVPATTVLLMVVILLVMPQGLLGKKE